MKNWPQFNPEVIWAIIMLVGICLIGYSYTLDIYTDKDTYSEKFELIAEDHNSPRFFELRDEYLTNKYVYADYGITLLCLSCFLFIFFSKGWKAFRIPRSKVVIIIIGFLAVLSTTLGYVGDLFVEMGRGSFPPWADSVGIPLMGVPMMFLVSFAWYLLNLIVLTDEFNSGEFVHKLRANKINYGYAIFLGLSMIMTTLCAFSGYFWLMVPGILWSYFYLSLLVGRRAGKLDLINYQPGKNIEN